MGLQEEGLLPCVKPFWGAVEDGVKGQRYRALQLLADDVGKHSLQCNAILRPGNVDHAKVLVLKIGHLQALRVY